MNAGRLFASNPVAVTQKGSRPMPPPLWLTSIRWSAPERFEHLRDNHHLIPQYAGVYIFTKHDKPVIHDGLGVIYVGESENSLRTRLKNYLKDPAEFDVFSKKHGPPKESSQLKHAGKNLILMELQQLSRGRSPSNTPSNIWIRWTQHVNPKTLEADLIRYLQPAFNTQGL
jgi:hypothetical protein